MKNKVQKQSKKTQDFSKIKQFFARIFGGIAKTFKLLRPLVLMQLKDKIDFSFLKSKKRTMFKIIYQIIIFVLITAIIYFMFSLIISFGIFSFVQSLNFRAYMVLMTVLFILSFVSCLAKVTTMLYFAKDNAVLITLPVKNSLIFTSKLIVSFIYELIKNITYILPFLIAYGVVMHLPATYYVWIVAALIIFTLCSTSLAGLLSIPAMLVSIILKKYRVFEFIIISALAGALVYGVISVINLIPNNLDLVRDWGKIFWAIQNFLKVFASKFVVFDRFLQLLTGMMYNSSIFAPFKQANLITLGIIGGIVAVCFVLIYILSKPLFLKMISTPFEFKKNENIKSKKNIKKSAFISSVANQNKIIFRTPNLVYSLLVVAVITPVMVFIQNKIIAVMDTRLLGNYMGIAFNVLIILLMTLSVNVNIASVYSRDGNSAYLNKINPAEYRVLLSSKLVFNAVVCSTSIIISVFIINIFTNMGVISAILLGVSLILICIAHLLWSAELDIMNPQNQQYQTTGEQQKNPNESKSMLIAFAMSVIFALVCFFLMSEDVRVVFYKLLFISILLCAARIYLYFTKVKLYYKEK